MVLAERAGIRLTAAEEQALDRIGLFVVGRPFRWRCALPTCGLAIPQALRGPATWSSEFDPQVDALFERLHAALQQACLERGEIERLAKEQARIERVLELLEMLDARYLRVERDELLMFEIDCADRFLV